MNILVIGNGFDLAHNLPTKYSDFLTFIKAVDDIVNYNQKNLDGYRLHPSINEFITNDFINKKDITIKKQPYWIEYIKDNIWIDYFTMKKDEINKGWIDFESEISKVIQSLDHYTSNVSDDEKMKFFMTDPFALKYIYMGKHVINGTMYSGINIMPANDMSKLLNEHLEKLILLLELYLTDYVNRIPINLLSPDIIECNANYILSFNYTHTYNKFYDPTSKAVYDYIHGKVRLNKDDKICNLILGIDEYLSDDKKNKSVNFIAFKKFYQRIFKETGALHKDWIDIMKHLETTWDNDLNIQQDKHQLYIYGHSLDISDADILSILILSDAVDTTIFYQNRDVYAQQITNLVKVIGQAELIRRTGGPYKSITFKQQKSMDENNNISQNISL